jgi:hypothetical protein
LDARFDFGVTRNLMELEAFRRKNLWAEIEPEKEDTRDLAPGRFEPGGNGKGAAWAAPRVL